MERVSERHRVPLVPGLTLIYHRSRSARDPIAVECAFRLGYADGEPGHIYALMKALQGQYAPAWRPQLTLTPDWSRLRFSASPEYRRSLDEQWRGLFSLESALTDLEPLREGLLQEQRFYHEASLQRLELAFQQLAFADTAYDRAPLGEEADLRALGQEQIFDTWQADFSHAPLWIFITDHQPLHQVLERIWPLLEQKRQPLSPLPLPPDGDGPREQRLHLPIEGGWLSLGFALPGMDQASWLYGPVMAAWLQEIWRLETPHTQLQLLDCNWLPWQRASLLRLRFYTPSPAEFQQDKLKLVQWLVQARRSYLTTHRLKNALQTVFQGYTQDPLPAYLQVDEMQEGWGHLRQRLQQSSLPQFQQALEHSLNSDRWTLLEACAPQISVRQQPDHLKDLAQLGFSPRPRPASSGRWSQIQRLHLSQGQSLWVVPAERSQQLELGLWFASGSADEATPGTTRLLLDTLTVRFAELLNAQDGKGASRHASGWQTGLSADACFFRWSVPPAELAQALRLLHGLLQSEMPDVAGLSPIRQALQLRLLTGRLDPALRGHAQFLHSTFGQHVYAAEVEGNYLSLQQIGPERLRQRWAELRQQGLVQPLLCGAVPQSFQAEMLEPVLSVLAPGGEPATLSAPRLRRGEIQLASSELPGFRYEGRLFAEALSLDDHAKLQLACRWVQDQIRSRWGVPVSCRPLTWRAAWGFALWGLFERQQRQSWWSDVHTLSEPLDMLQQRLLAEWRQHSQQREHYWFELVHWLSLGGTPGAFADRERQLLTLRREELETFLASTWSQEAEWVQVVFQDARTRGTFSR